MHPVAAVLVASEGEDVRRLDPASDVWHIAAPRLFAKSRSARVAQVEACRAATFSALISSMPQVFIQHEDPPDDYGIAGPWVASAAKTWAIPAGFAMDDPASAGWLALGCWTVYAARHPITEPWPDVFRIPPAAAMQWLKAHDAQAAICSWHDDDEWRVIVSTA
jgi:hypothetical protein